ncbi:MAG: pantoate--beta-alanine ligase [Bacillota bacterium]
MKKSNKISDVKKFIKDSKGKKLSIGLVPTMGYLHEGHLSLVEASKKENDVTVLTIFVNPTQFAPNEDLSKYPRNMERDLKLCSEAGVDFVFAPEVSELYPESFSTYVNVEGITSKLCGKSRPTHFRGVTTIMSKLFNILAPDRAYFGQKDAQQYFVIERMTADLNMDIRLEMCPIVREDDGLAISSRNIYLSPDERKQSLILSESLKLAEDLILSGQRNVDIVISEMRKNIEKMNLANIDYIEIVQTKTLQPAELINGSILVALAVRFGNTRLIDNIILEVKNV